MVPSLYLSSAVLDLTSSRTSKIRFRRQLSSFHSKDKALVAIRGSRRARLGPVMWHCGVQSHGADCNHAQMDGALEARR